ncbi:MAG: translocation/assembly module TamB domain-containing protein [Acidobacteriota bacterium]|nr:translocation/assembly module TamB domain-containing protein [Acidobacteriota bacterium]
MTRSRRIALVSGGTSILLLLIAAITGVVLVRNGWVAEKIRERVVNEAARATGGKVEIGALAVDWRTLTATLDKLVIHGNEPAGSAPLLVVERAIIRFRIISLLQEQFNVASIRAEMPRVHLIVAPDGSTNLPRPKTAPDGKTGPETILDLKIGSFDLAEGSVAVEREGAASTTPWTGRGENLVAHVTYNGSGPRYDGNISIAPLAFAWNGSGRTGVQVNANISAVASMEKNRLAVSTATVKSGHSELDLSNVLVNDFAAPVTTAQYKMRVALADARQVIQVADLERLGFIDVNGNARFASAVDYAVTGAIRGQGIGYGKVRNIRLSGNVSATPDRLTVKAMLVNALGGDLRGDGAVSRLEDFRFAGRLNRFDARALVALAGGGKLPYDGIVSGPFEASGKLSAKALRHLTAGATLQIAPAAKGVPVHGQVAAKFNGAANTLVLEKSWFTLPNTRLDLSGVLGQKLSVKLQSQDLSDLAPVMDSKALPATLAKPNGSVTFDGSVSGPLRDPRIAGNASVQNAEYRGQKIDWLTGDFTAMKTRASVSNGSLVSGNLRVRVSGSVELRQWEPVKTSAVNANVQVMNADVGKLAAMAGGKSIPVSGTLNTTTQITGTVGDPHATANLTLTRGQIFGEPYDIVTANAQYLSSGTQALTAVLNAGRKRIRGSARFERPDKLTFSLASNAMAIDQIALARKAEPELQGTTQIKADGVVRLPRGKAMEVESLNADLNAAGIALGTRRLGKAHLTADTKNGVLTARLDSDMAKSMIHGEGTVRLGGNYPMNAKLAFSGLGLGEAAALARGTNPNAAELNLDGSAAGEISVRGPAKSFDAWTASFDVSQFEAHPLRVTGDARNIANLSLRNNGPIRAVLANSVVRIESARFAAPSTSISITGAVDMNSRSPFNLQVQGNMNLALAETFDADLTAAGQLTLNAAVRGSYANPDIAGRAELRQGDFHLTNFSNGLTNANGVILFNGTRATIQSLSAESGGGKVAVTGFGAMSGGMGTFRLEAKTRAVRVRYPEGVSTISDADLTLAGTTARSEASGTVTVRRVSINPKSDLSTILAGAAQPLKAPEAGTGLLSNMNLDVGVETAPDVAFETSVAQSIEADANLRLRGTAANPAVLGRINISQGELNFFGNKYTINQGSVSFFNPAKIDPILNVDLETKARGVAVTLTVSGPINKLNVSYRSDPPLQFSDIVALLATGRTPTDPTLAVRDTGASQSLQQMGASALIGQAIANPVAGRLQRFFGVSKIKIDPQLTGITGSPEARLTIEQQVTPDLLFTYINDVSSTSTQLIRVEWDFNRRWAAILTREENGYVGVDFAYKKRFK